MSEDIELQDMRDDRQPGEESSGPNLSCSTPLQKTGKCCSTLFCYRCAVLCLGVLCLLLAISIRVLWTKTTSEINQMQTVTASLKELQLRYKNLAEYHLDLQCTTEDQLKTKFSDARDELQRRLCERESHDMKNIKQHAVDVTLDPDTAHPNLILSADGKQVKQGYTRQNLTDTPKRFNQSVSVLGREGFSSGKFYYEVHVTGRNHWTIGLARESSRRHGPIHLDPKYGYWTIGLRGGYYRAFPRPIFSVKGKLQRVGVSVDYDAGLVSFYDASCWDHIYSFSHVSFTEKIYPYFCPGPEGGTNSAPLIISSVRVCPIK